MVDNTRVVASGISRFESFQLLFAGILEGRLCIIHIVTLYEERERDLTFQDELYCMLNNIFKQREVCLRTSGHQFDTFL